MKDPRFLFTTETADLPQFNALYRRWMGRWDEIIASELPEDPFQPTKESTHDHTGEGSLVSFCQVLLSEWEEEDVFGGGGSSEIVSGRQ